MKTLITTSTGGLFFVLIIIQGCASGNKINRTQNPIQNSNNVISADQSTLTLADYLRRLPGVMVQGQGNNVLVFIRGTQSVNAGSEPLYVLNGQPLGNRYSSVSSSVDINDIDNIQILKGSEGSTRYGLRGSNGVVLIKTKEVRKIKAPWP